MNAGRAITIAWHRPLSSVNPARTPLRLSLGLEPVEVGRDCSGLLLTDPLVSRRHLELRRIGTAVQIVELGSTNGTLVDGMPLTGSHWLSDGEIVGLGSTTIVLSSNDRDDAPVPAAFTVLELNPPRVLTNPTGRRRGVALVGLVVLAVAALAFPRGRPESSVAEPVNSSQTDDTRLHSRWPRWRPRRPRSSGGHRRRTWP
jgi:hypothetical protein